MQSAMSSSREERLSAEIARFSCAGLDGIELLRRTARALHAVIPFAAYCSSTTDPASNLITRGIAEGLDGPIPDAEADAIGRTYFEQVYFEEELDQIVHMQETRESAISLYDMMAGKPERSLRYRAMHRPFGLDDEIGMIFADSKLWGGLEIIRAQGDARFTPREVEVVKRVTPHVAAGLKAAALGARAREEPGGDVPGVLVIDVAGRVVSSTPAAERLLAELEPEGPGWRNGPPAPVPVIMVLGALRNTLQPRSEADRHRIPSLRLRSRAGRWLTLHAAMTETSEERSGERIVVIAPAPPDEVAWLTLEAHALTPREEEVVKLVVGGLSTKQIADRLFIAEHTVQRHLSNIFEKVGVRSRRALVKQFFFEQVLSGAA